MKRISAMAAALLAGAVVLAPGDMRAQGRAAPAPKRAEPVQQVPISPEERARQLVEMETWLRRLVGKFRIVDTLLEAPVLEHCGIPGYNLNKNCAFPRTYQIKQSLKTEPWEGSGECESIASGPGVRCRLRYTNWTRVLLFGLDPDAPGIRLIWAAGGWYFVAPGSLQSDTVTFQTGCPWILKESRDGNHCSPIWLFRAKSDGKGVEILSQEVPGGFGHLLDLRRIEEPGG